MTFRKGVSGNPSGRPKASPRIRRTITELAREHSETALRTLVTVMKSPKSTMTARAIAADRILDRAYGKAPQAIGVVLAPARRPEDLTDAELAAIVAGTIVDGEAQQVEQLALEDASDSGVDVEEIEHTT
jgi:hypothetical protein